MRGVAHHPAAGTLWLDVFRPGCGTGRPIDLRTVDRHPLALVGTLVVGLPCFVVSGGGTNAEAARSLRVPPARGNVIAR
jgi:hypothetical protein